MTKLAPKTGRGPVHVRHEFAERIFAEYPECAIPRVAIQAVEADITVDEINREIRVNIDHLIAYAFRDALTGAVRFVQTNGVIRDA